ncbi:MAG TPA: hypothetical protein DGK99_05670, partial [Acidimicrobiaceae bacterium]|nr:hypothetical protein [Acidimicrobiaceae bacterium]
MSSRTTTRVTTQTSSSTEFFDCAGDQGGWLYQVIWEQKGTGNTFELLRYDVDKEEYTVAASYRSKNVPGDTDGDGNPNGLSMDPEGRAYVTYARDEDNKHVDLIQLLPKGKFKVIADITSPGKKDLNAGTYVEENGKPYVIVSSGFANGRGKKVDLTNGTVTDWEPKKGSPFGAKEKNVKDYVWVAEGIEYRGETYNIVGLEMKGTTGNVLLASSDPNVKMVTDTVSAPSDYSGTYGAAFNFKPGGVDSDEPTAVFFSNNGKKPAEKAFLTQLTWDDSDGDAAGSFTLGTIGDTQETSKNDGGGCPFANLPNVGSVVVWPPDCKLDNPTANGSTFPVEITNQSDKTATFYVTVTVNGRAQAIKDFGRERAPVEIAKEVTKKFTFDIEWGDEWEAEVELNGEKLAFAPTGGVLNEEACGGEPVDDGVFLPTATSSVICAVDGGKADVTVTLDNMESTMDAEFVVTSTIGGVVEEEFAGTVNASDSKEIEILVPHGSEWSLEWEASDPKDSGTRTERSGLPVTGSETANCPPDDVFEPGADVIDLDCSEQGPPPYEVTVTLDNMKSTMDVIFVVTSTIDGAVEEEFNDTVGGGLAETVNISVPEDATWSVSWQATNSQNSFEVEKGNIPESGSNQADCVGDPDPEIIGNVYGYVWADWDKSGTRTEIKDGAEEHVAGAVATLTNTTDYFDEEGQVLYGPGGYVEMATTGDETKGGSDAGDYRWFISDVPVEDQSGNIQQYTVQVDYADATFPPGFTPAGYTVQNNEDNVLADETDSDVAPLAGSIGESAPFSLVENLDEHRVDAGVVTDIAFEPTAEVTIDCDSGTAQVTLDNTLSAVDASFTVDAWAGTRSDVNRLDGSGTQVVAGGASSDYDQIIATPAGQVLLIRITAIAWDDGTDLGLGSFQVWDQSVSDAPARFCPAIHVIATDCPPTVVLNNSQSEVDVVYLLTTMMNLDEVEEDEVRVDPLTVEPYELPTLSEGANWYLEWVITDPDDPNRRYEGTIPGPVPNDAGGWSFDQFRVDCEPPPFEPVVELETACSHADYGNFALATGVMEVRVDNRVSGVDAVVRILVNGSLRESATVAAGEVSGTLESEGDHGDVFTVEVSAGSDTHLYDLKAESGTLDCPYVWVDVVSDEIDCTSNSPTITVTFKNNSETAIDLGFFTQLNAPAGSGGEFVASAAQQVLLPAGGEETRTFSLKKNWTFNLTWSAAMLGTETAFTASGQFPNSPSG